jgi:hypothetical protein
MTTRTSTTAPAVVAQNDEATTDQTTTDAPAFTVGQISPEQYVAADRSGRAQMRAAWVDALNAAVRSADMLTAQTIIAERDAAEGAVRSSSGGSSEPIDLSAVLAQRIADLRLAADMLAAGQFLPVGVTPEQINADTLAEHLSTITPDNDTAQSIAQTRVSRAGQRGDVAAYVAARLAALGDGTHRVARIRAEAIDGYRPSSGAVSARLAAVLESPDASLGWVAVAATSDAPLSARLV